MTEKEFEALAKLMYETYHAGMGTEYRREIPWDKLSLEHKKPYLLDIRDTLERARGRN